MKKANPSDEKLASNYEFISCFRHPAAVQVDNCWRSESWIIAVVSGTFCKWLAQADYNALFTAEGAMLPLIREMMM
jgi:hypothetical protein